MEYTKIINGYSIFEQQSEGTKPEERLKDITIFYYSDNEYFSESPRFKKIPESRVEKAKHKLFDHTLYNQQQKSIVSAIPFITLVNEVERIILNE
jgi:hypothetical protein